jgi:hypothetical protein
MRVRWMTAALAGVALLAASVAACGGDRGQDEGGDAGAAEGAPPGVAVDGPASAFDSASGQGGDGGTRAALPALFGIMAGLQEDMSRVGRGLWVERYDSIAAAARAVADHPRVTPEEARRIADVLGADMPRFKAADTRVHDLAVRLERAAGRRDMAAVLTAESELRSGCVECHTRFRERLRQNVER